MLRVDVSIGLNNFTIKSYEFIMIKRDDRCGKKEKIILTIKLLNLL